MNLWDSVHRGLEKASQEAARIAKSQRLRSTIDGLQRQTQIQNGALATKCMDLFSNGQLTQSELIPLCQELASVLQQLEQAQNELKLLQQQATSTNTTPPAPAVSGPPVSDLETIAIPPPPPGYQSYQNNPTPIPPPPPGVSMFAGPPSEPIGAFDALAEKDKRRCPQCGTELVPGKAYCHNCGALVQQTEASELPTFRAGTETGAPAESAPPPSLSSLSSPAAPPSPPSTIDQLETMRGEPPPVTPNPPQQSDGGK